MPIKETFHRPVSELFSGAFRKGIRFTNWRPRGSGDWLLIYTEKGSGRYVTPTGTFDTKAGDVTLFAPTDYQDYSTQEEIGEWHLLWVHFIPKPYWQPWLHWPLAKNGIRLLPLEDPEVREQFRVSMRRMHRVFQREVPGANDLAANALEAALLWAKVATSKGPWLTIDPRVRKAMDHLIEHHQEPFVLSELAAHSGLSVSRLAALFKQQTSVSPQQFLERHRMQNARQLLRLTSLSITEVASEVGYEDPFYFTNRFRRFTGKSPSQFRKNASPEA